MSVVKVCMNVCARACACNPACLLSQDQLCDSGRDKMLTEDELTIIIGNTNPDTQLDGYCDIKKMCFGHCLIAF